MTQELAFLCIAISEAAIFTLSCYLVTHQKEKSECVKESAPVQKEPRAGFEPAYDTGQVKEEEKKKLNIEEYPHV
jgi:hypothetical protein